MGSLEKMKGLEKEYRQYLPKKSYAVVRVDGKGFSKYTKGLEKPFDAKFSLDMAQTARYLAENVDGAVLAYTQSDEISVIFSDLSGENTEWWFGGQTQKIASITAAMATAKFNSLRNDEKLAVFDARVHHISTEREVLEYLDWRQSDAIKNSVGMLASHHFSHKELQGMSTHERVYKLATEKNVFWSQLAPCFRFGSTAKRTTDEPTLVLYQKKGVNFFTTVQRKRWVTDATVRFDEKDRLEDI